MKYYIKEIEKYSCESFAFPFETKLSFGPLITEWQNGVEECGSIIQTLSKNVLEKMEGIPELQGEIKQREAIENNEEFVFTLMSIVFSPAYWDTQIVGLVAPFSLTPFFASPTFKRLNPLSPEHMALQTHLNPSRMTVMKTVKAYLAIMERFYNTTLESDAHHLVFFLPDEHGLDRYYRVEVSTKFCEIQLKGELPKLSESDKKKLLSDIWNVDQWERYLPSERFCFYGFTVFQAIDITKQQLLSDLKHELIDTHALISEQTFRVLEHKLRSILKKPDIRLGLTAFPENSEKRFQFSYKIGDRFLCDENANCASNGLNCSIYQRAISSKNVVIISDLADDSHTNEVHNQLTSIGIKNILIAPLVYETETVGLIEIGSEHVNDLNHLNLFLLEDVFPLFALAVKRHIEFQETKIETIIKEKCTAIHPSVEWRFKDAARTFLTTDVNEIEEIVFHDVFPLFGLSDIRNSSITRNSMIQEDLLSQLQFCKLIVEEGYKETRLPVLDELKFRIEKQIAHVDLGLNSGDEIEILEFIKTDVESVFQYIQNTSDHLDKQINDYQNVRDPELGFIYDKRKQFEQSVSKINDVISSYIDEQQIIAQKMFPHYFEKYKTDGVDYGLYIGQSLTKTKEFGLIYLKNIRLWQLILMCKVVQKAEKIIPQLEIALETAHLILVQDQPLSIRFRYDEKHFDVDGAYNIRYEIIKKRIDKAVIKNTKERLTQPKKIAIVYSQQKEYDEYCTFIEYLVSKGLILPEIESFELENLQGIQGLRAIRIQVSDLEKEENSESLIKEFENILNS